ncbi:MAG: PEP-CTERM sorting domain-containing protein [Methylobacter sp.]|nr:PEP-CTERM sorting domain-containing protein [Methylobacter sp.]
MLKINLLLFTVALSIPPTGQAAISWTFTNPSATMSTASGITASASAFSTNLPGAAGTGNGSAGTTFAAATATPYSGGIGINNADEAVGVAPEHAVDNAVGVDAALFTFTGGAVTLQSLSIGWKSGDADISVLAYTGSSAPATLIGKSFANLLTSGWSFIGNYADLAVGTAKTINTAAISSSYWLISAYTSALGSTVSGGGSVDLGNDYFKILALSGDPTVTNNVPEPSAILLLALGLGGWRMARNHQGNLMADSGISTGRLLT